jgi:hypothetical protein
MATRLLESPGEAELPLDAPAHGYPTAIRASLSDDASPEPTPTTNANHATASEAAQASTTTPAHDATSQQPAPVVKARRDASLNHPPLAVIPPQFVHPTASAARTNEAATTQSQLAPGQSQQPTNLAFPAAAALLPQVESGLLPSVSAWQPPQALPAPAAIAMPATPIASMAASSEATALADKGASIADHQARLDHALKELIDALEADIRQRRAEVSSDEELPRLEQQLRLAYIAAGRLDEAVASVDSLEPSQREAFKNLMFGLGVWLSPDEARRPPLRSAKVLHSIREATADLAAASKLELRNLVFCERVDYFGWYTEFPRKEFAPKQQVILYVEVENFAAEHKGPAGYETELHGSYEILDSSGQIVASRQLQPDKEICRNYRRDYFLAYRIYMPDNIAPGHYRLELAVEDMKAKGKYQGRKLGEGMIEFTIR